MDQIDWDTHGKALQRQPTMLRIRLIKFLHNWLNTGEQKVRINSNAVGDCPICGKEEESWMHLLKCEHIKAVTTRTAAVTKLKGDLRRLKTAPIITTVLIYKINQWTGNTSDKPPQIPGNEVGLHLGLALEEQADIGWENFMKGRV